MTWRHCCPQMARAAYLAGMIVYSVTVNVQPSVQAEWVGWMRDEHIPQVMATGKFEDFEMLRLLKPEPEDGSVTYNIQYVCKSLHQLDAYQREDAEALQADHRARFGESTVAFRTILKRLTE